MNDSVQVVQVVGEAIRKAIDSVPQSFIEQEPDDAFELLSAKLLTELFARGYYVMTKDEILGLVQRGFFTLGKQGKTKCLKTTERPRPKPKSPPSKNSTRRG